MGESSDIVHIKYLTERMFSINIHHSTSKAIATAPLLWECK